MPDDVHLQDVLIKDVLKVMRSWHAGRLTSVQEWWIRTVLESHVAGPRQGDLFAPVGPRESTRVARLVTRMLCGDHTCHDPLALQTLKLASVIGDLRAGRPERVQPWEASTVEAVIGPITGGTRDVPAHGAAPSEPVPVDGPVEFTFTWSSGSARSPRNSTSTALVALSEVDPVDAPVACSLRTAAGRLELRRLDARWLRPVLSPGSWEPVTVADFRQAVASGAAWRDNPFLSRAPRGCPDFHLSSHPRDRTMAKGDDRRLSEARDACLARAGELFVVAGVVHRSTTAPMAGVCVVQEDGIGRACAAWIAGDLGSTGGMDTLAHREGVVRTWFDGRSMPKHDGGQDPDDVFVPLSAWMGVVRSASDGAADPWSSGRIRSLLDEDLVRQADAYASTPDTWTCLQAAMNLAERLLPVTHHLYRSDGSLEPFLRFKEALVKVMATRDDVRGGTERSHIGLRRACADVLDATTTATGPRDTLWVYAASLAFHAVEDGCDLGSDADELASIRF